jgi:prepilin signal peptidase PulO-like enzyme (type II secretory pathway)
MDTFIHLWHATCLGVWDMKIGYVLCGVILSIQCGFTVGNYACSLVHRLPRGKMILDKPPYCGSCGTLLATKDLFPVFSALLLHHKCRYCYKPFPKSHTWTELLVGLLFTLAFLRYSFGQEFLLVSVIGVFWITLAAIETNESMIMRQIIICLIVAGTLNRVLVDGTIYGFFESGLYGLLAGVFIWRKSVKKVGHIYVLPGAAQAVTVGALCVGLAGIKTFVVLAVALYVLFALLAKAKGKPLVISIPIGLAATYVVLYPNLPLL